MGTRQKVSGVYEQGGVGHPRQDKKEKAPKQRGLTNSLNGSAADRSIPIESDFATPMPSDALFRLSPANTRKEPPRGSNLRGRDQTRCNSLGGSELSATVGRPGSRSTSRLARDRFAHRRA